MAGSGFKMSLGGAKAKLGLKNQPTSLTKRPRLALGDDDEPEDKNAKLEISGFDAAKGGAVEIHNGKPKEEKKLLVIPLPTKTDRRTYPQKKAAQWSENDTVEVAVADKTYGLQIKTKERTEDSLAEQGDAVMADAPAETIDDGLTEEERLEKKAIHALLHDKTPADATTIPMLTEEALFAADLAAAPDAPSLDAYEATPIEGFGAALLRGMGWKDGEELGRNKGVLKKQKEVKPRPALLGIGAKDEAAAGLEPGAWEKGKPKRKTAQTYNPIALRNKITGEIITEEELKGRLERQKLDDEREKKEARIKKFAFEEEKSEDESEGKRKQSSRLPEKGREGAHKDRTRDRRRDDSYDDRRREKRSREKRDRSRSPDTNDRRPKERRRHGERSRSRSRSRDSEDRRTRDRRSPNRNSEGRRGEDERQRYRSKDVRPEKDSRHKDRRRDYDRDSEDSRKRRRDKEYYDDESDRRDKRRHKERSSHRSERY